MAQSAKMIGGAFGVFVFCSQYPIFRDEGTRPNDFIGTMTLLQMHEDAGVLVVVASPAFVAWLPRYYAQHAAFSRDFCFHPEARDGSCCIIDCVAQTQTFYR